jgi:hypothetical protein
MKAIPKSVLGTLASIIILAAGAGLLGNFLFPPFVEYAATGNVYRGRGGPRRSMFRSTTSSWSSSE